jgi:hypothetical protein
LDQWETRVSSQELKELGYTRLPDWPDAALLATRLKHEPTYTGHVIPQGDRILRSWEDATSLPPGDRHFHACHDLGTILRCAPTLLPYVMSHLPLVEEFFEEQPLLYSVNAFWKKPSDRPGWHRDLDDRKQAVIFIYGTDVLTIEDGVHTYWRKSTEFADEEVVKYHNIPDAQPPEEDIERFLGPAGTAFMTNTRGLHNGYPPKNAPRLLIWARFGVSDPPATYIADEIKPIPASRLPLMEMEGRADLRHATHLIVDWNA